jgi:hypothetical protein
MVTFACGIAAPELSLTVPEIEPVTCAPPVVTATVAQVKKRIADSAKRISHTSHAPIGAALNNAALNAEKIYQSSRAASNGFADTIIGFAILEPKGGGLASGHREEE